MRTVKDVLAGIKKIKEEIIDRERKLAEQIDVDYDEIRNDMENKSDKSDDKTEKDDAENTEQPTGGEQADNGGAEGGGEAPAEGGDVNGGVDMGNGNAGGGEMPADMPPPDANMQQPMDNGAMPPPPTDGAAEPPPPAEQPPADQNNQEQPNESTIEEDAEGAGSLGLIGAAAGGIAGAAKGAWDHFRSKDKNSSLLGSMWSGAKNGATIGALGGATVGGLSQGTADKAKGFVSKYVPSLANAASSVGAATQFLAHPVDTIKKALLDFKQGILQGVESLKWLSENNSKELLPTPVSKDVSKEDISVDGKKVSQVIDKGPYVQFYEVGGNRPMTTIYVKDKKDYLKGFEAQKYMQELKKTHTLANDKNTLYRYDPNKDDFDMLPDTPENRKLSNIILGKDFSHTMNALNQGYQDRYWGINPMNAAYKLQKMTSFDGVDKYNADEKKRLDAKKAEKELKDRMGNHKAGFNIRVENTEDEMNEDTITIRSIGDIEDVLANTEEMDEGAIGRSIGTAIGASLGNSIAPGLGTMIGANLGGEIGSDVGDKIG